MSFMDRLRSLLGAVRGPSDDAGRVDREGFNGAPPTSGAGTGLDPVACLDAVRVLQEFLDGELDDLPYDRMRAHFDTCARCYPHLRLEQAFRDAVSRAARGEAPPLDLRGRVTDLLSRTGGLSASEASGDDTDAAER